MASSLSYYRPRGVMGNYIVEVILDLAETETGEVWVARNRGSHNCGHCGKQEPTQVKLHPANGTIHLAQYIINDLISGDTIAVKIKDENVVPLQETYHTATMEGFYHEPIPFRHNGYVWE